MTLDVHEYDRGYALDALRADAQRATANWNWARGAHGHVLSLPRAGQLHPSSRYRYENSPCTGRLDACPYFREIFHSFESPKISFRLLRRPAGTAYGWHTDVWKGHGVARFQIPISADDDSFLVLTDFERTNEVLPELMRAVERREAEEILQATPDHVRIHRLAPGRLYHFGTSRMHTLVNASQNDRLTLSIDLVVDPWLLERFPDVADEVGPNPDGPSLPSPPGLALEFCRSRLHPLRNLAQRFSRGST